MDRKNKMNVVHFIAEKYYRLAFDYFHYENNIQLAQKYINLALKDDKSHIKSLMLKGEILLRKRNMQSALKTFLKIQKLFNHDHENTKILLCGGLRKLDF